MLKWRVCRHATTTCNASWVISNMVETRREVPQCSYFCKLFEGIWNNYVDIQQKNIIVRFIMILCTRGHKSLGDLTRSLKEKHVLNYNWTEASAMHWGDIFTVLNFCILIAKYHIYCQRFHNENRIKKNQYLIELKNKLRIERYICTSTATIEKFDKFQFLYEQH